MEKVSICTDASNNKDNNNKDVDNTLPPPLISEKDDERDSNESNTEEEEAEEEEEMEKYLKPSLSLQELMQTDVNDTLDDDNKKKKNELNDASKEGDSSSIQQESVEANEKTTATNDDTKEEEEMTFEMPSLEDRICLFRRIEELVNRQIQATDQRRYAAIKRLERNWLDSVTKAEIPFHSQQQFMRLFLLPTISAALLIPLDVIVSNNSKQQKQKEQEENDESIQKPLETMTLLISNIIWLSKGTYDARIRHVIKIACVELLQQVFKGETFHQNPNMALYLLRREQSQANGPNSPPKGTDFEIDVQPTAKQIIITPQRMATTRFEALEKAVAANILKRLVEQDKQKKQQQQKQAATTTDITTNQTSITRKQANLWIRGLQITTVSLFVGGLFAVTGGLVAGPPLVAAITAFGTGIGTTAAFATLTTTAAMASMFGVVGGGLAAYKMKKRTDGLSEWKIRKEHKSDKETRTIRGLHATVGVSGWVRDKSDFQRPWGIMPTDPPITDRLELLQRFFTVKAPEKLTFCKALLKAHKKDHHELWDKLKQRYGSDPNSLVPFGPPDEEGDFRIFPQAEETLLETTLTSYSVPKEEMEQILENNRMLLEMEFMNAETFANMNDETMELLAQSPHRPIGTKDNSGETQESVETQDEGGQRLVEKFKQEEEEDSPLDDVVEQQVKEESTDNETGDVEPKAEDGDSNDAEDGLASTSMEETTTSSSARDAESLFGDDQAKSNVVVDNADGIVGDIPKELNVDPSLNKEDESKPDLNLMPASDSDEDGKADNINPSTPSKGKNEKSLERSNSSFLSTHEEEPKGGKKDHTLVVWDWEAMYGGDLYTVTWESNFLLNLCRVAEVLFFEISNQVSKEILKQTLIGGLVSAVAIPSAISTAAGVIDDPYQLISFRSEKAGIELAHCLMQSEERRPVSLVGFSFGARVIFTCLLELERHQALWEEKQRPNNKQPTRKELAIDKLRRLWRQGIRRKGDEDITYNREPASIVEDVVLIGLPRLVDWKEWVRCREIVGGRLVNCYNRSDWVVSYMINIRCWNGIKRTCGTHPIDVDGVENYEVSEFAASHGRYPYSVPQILDLVRFGQPN